MRSIRKLSDVPRLRALLAGVILIVSTTASAQSRASIPRVFSGPLDSQIPIPVANDNSGEKAPTALSLLKTAAKTSDFLQIGDIECKGTLIRNRGYEVDETPITFVISSHGRFQMTLTERGGIREVRATGTNVQAQRKDGTKIHVDTSEFGLLLALPMQITEIIERTDMSLREDEEQAVDGEAVRVLTATLFRTRSGEPTTASFYLDKAALQLKKVAILTKTRGYRPLESIEVASYGAYKSVNNALVPFEYEVTRDGQVVYTVHLSSASVTVRHEDSFFKY